MKTYTVALVVALSIVLLGGAYYVTSEQRGVSNTVTLEGVEITTPDGFVIVTDRYSATGVSETSFIADEQNHTLSFDIKNLFSTDRGVLALPFTYSVDNDVSATYVAFFSSLQGPVVHEATAFLGESVTDVTFVQVEDELTATYRADTMNSFRTFKLENGVVSEWYEVTNGSKGDIYVHEPSPHNMVSTRTLLLAGAARGYWFFEADMPVELRDEEGHVLATSFVTAQDDWMTEGVVDFKGVIEVPEEYEGDGYLIVHRDNASGLREYTASLRLPIVINTTTR